MYRGYAKPEARRQMVERPTATATQRLPKEDVVVAEPRWQEIQEQGKVIGLTGYLKLPESLVAKFERLSGAGGVFVRCIARRRPVQTGAPLASSGLRGNPERQDMRTWH
eukprot:1284843-Alexandrium_andersonii.AAC.1